MNINEWFNELIHDILINGVEKEGRNGKMLARFVPPIFISEPLHFGGFPLWSIKACAFKKTQIEGLFFLSGSSQTADLPPILRDWWDPWMESATFGRFYGYQLRHKEGYFDQIQNVAYQLRHEGWSRRICLNVFNSADVDKAVLPPCHMSFVQFFRRYDEVDVYFYQRSADVLLGLPHNIAWAAMMTILICNECGLIPGILKYQPGIAHIYDAHVDAAQAIYAGYRKDYKLPTWSLQPIYEGLDIDMVLAKAQSNCMNKNEVYDTPIVLQNYKPLWKAKDLPPMPLIA